MKVYLVRHGESEYNAKRLHQHSGVELTDTGRKQARATARRFAGIPLDAIFTSDYARALETAEIINSNLGKKLTVTELLREIRRPSEIIGKPQEDPDVLEIKEQITAHDHDPNWHYSDEENFYDVRARIQKFIAAFLHGRSEDAVLVVAHGLTIRVIAALLMADRTELTPGSFFPFARFAKTSNAGITILQSCDHCETPKWHLHVWNDHSHLV